MFPIDFYVFFDFAMAVATSIYLQNWRKRIMKVLQKLTSALMSGVMILSLGTGLQAASDRIRIDSKNFPDTKFRQTVSKVADKNKDGYLTESERNSVSCFLLEDVNDIKGITYFKYLNQLTLFECGVESVDLRKNQYLSNFAALACGSLKSVTTNVFLNKFEVSFCPVTSVDLSASSYLRQVKMIDDRKFKGTLDLSESDLLTDITVLNTPMRNIKFSNDASLRYVDIEFTKLESLDISKCIKFDRLDALLLQDIGTNTIFVPYEILIKLYGKTEYSDDNVRIVFH